MGLLSKDYLLLRVDDHLELLRSTGSKGLGFDYRGAFCTEKSPMSCIGTTHSAKGVAGGFHVPPNSSHYKIHMRNLYILNLL